MEHGAVDTHAANISSLPTSTSKPIRIVTFNVNGLKAVLHRLYGASGTISKFLEDVGSNADIVCLQETKLRRSELTAATHQLASADGWDCFFSCSTSSRGYSGTATFCRTDKTLPFAAELGFSGLLNNDDTFAATSPAPDPAINSNPSPPSTSTPFSSTSSLPRTCHQELLRDFSIEELRNLDTEGRVIITDHGVFILFNIYAPAVTKEDPDQAKLRLSFKIRFYTALQRRWEALLAAGRAVIVVGDLNIAPEPIDFPDYDPDYYRSTRPDRIWLRDLLSLGSSGNSGESFSSGEGFKNGALNGHGDGTDMCTNINNKSTKSIHKAMPTSFVDCFRYFHPERRDAFTVWSIATGARSNNYGSRIDLTLSAGLYVGKEAPPRGAPRNSIQTADASGADLPLSRSAQIIPHHPIILNDQIYVSAADIEPAVQGSDHCPAWVEVTLNPNYIISKFDKTTVTDADAAAAEAAAPVMVFPCSKTAPPCAMRFCGKQTKLHSWLAMGKTTKRNEEVMVREDEASEDIGTAAGKQPPPPPHSIVPVTVASGYPRGGGNGGNRPKQMSLKSFVKVSSSTSQKPAQTPAAINTETVIKNEKTAPNESTFLHAELQAAAALEQKQLSSAKNAWQAIQERMQTPMCLHNDPAALKKVNKSGPNQGRFFYMCARGKGQGPNAQCSFFKWVEKKAGDAPRTTLQGTRGKSSEAGPGKRFKK